MVGASYYHMIEKYHKKKREANDARIELEPFLEEHFQLKKMMLNGIDINEISKFKDKRTIMNMAIKDQSIEIKKITLDSTQKSGKKTILKYIPENETEMIFREYWEKKYNVT